jgi:hypothetical protein
MCYFTTRNARYPLAHHRDMAHYDLSTCDQLRANAMCESDGNVLQQVPSSGCQQLPICVASSLSHSIDASGFIAMCGKP